MNTDNGSSYNDLKNQYIVYNKDSYTFGVVEITKIIDSYEKANVDEKT